MRIGISAVFHLAGGGRTHLESLLRAWHQDGVDTQHSITLFARGESIQTLNPRYLERVAICEVGGKSLSREKKLVWEQTAFPAMLPRMGIDVLLCPGSIVPFRSAVPRVVIMRNAAPFCPDVTIRRVGLQDWIQYKVLGRAMAISGRVAERVIFISKHFRDLFLQLYPRPLEECEVIYHGRDTLPEGSPSAPPSGRYFLSHAHLHRYKNFPALIEGYHLAKDVLQKRGIRLLLAGGNARPSHLHLLEQMIRRRSLENWVQLLGPVEPAVSISLLRGCEFFIFQSTCENCPNALLEALALGLPIACANASVMPELAGDAAEYFDPLEPGQIAAVMAHLAQDPARCADLRRRAIQRAQQFPTWTEVGRRTLRVLEEAASARRHTFAASGVVGS